MKNKKLFLYLLLAFGIAWILQVIASLCYLQGQRTLWTLLFSISMFVPFLSYFLTHGTLKGLGWTPRIKRNWKVLLLAWLLPILLSLLGALFFFLLFPSSLDLSGSGLETMGGAGTLALLKEQGITPKMMMLISLLQATLYGPFINMFVTLGEEVGWRGYLHQELKERFGREKGIVFSGIIWGAWHWPVMILAGYEYGFGYWGFPVVGMVLFCFFSVSCGILLDYVHEKSGTIWAPSLLHGSFNAIAGVPLMLLSSSCTKYQLLGPAPVGIIGGLPLMILAAFLFFRGRKTT